MLEKRDFKVFHNTKYKINNVSLCKSIKIIRKDRKLYKIIINGVHISPSSISDNYIIFDFSILREKYRDLIPMNEKDNDYIALETTFSFNSLYAQHHYKYLDKNSLNNSIFINSDLEIYISPLNFLPPSIELEEEYYVSDIHMEKIENEKIETVIPKSMEELL